MFDRSRGVVGILRTSPIWPPLGIFLGKLLCFVQHFSEISSNGPFENMSELVQVMVCRWPIPEPSLLRFNDAKMTSLGHTPHGEKSWSSPIMIWVRDAYAPRFKIREGLLPENVKSHLHNKITYIKHHFLTIGKDTGWCIYPHFLCIHNIIIGNRVHKIWIGPGISIHKHSMTYRNPWSSPCGLGLSLLIWIDFNPSMDK